MSTRLARSFDEAPSPDLPEQFSGSDISKISVGLTDCLDGKRRALVVTDIAELLSISERQVYKLVAAHRIPCFKIGGSIRFDPLAISVWLRQKMSPGCVEHRAERRTRTSPVEDH
jgi:excisionase family DNA binding protein